MMPVVRITDNTARKLQKLSVPLIDNYDTVIGRLVDAALSGKPYEMPEGVLALKEKEAPPQPSPANRPLLEVEAQIAGAETHDDLTHTRLRRASFGGVEIPRAKWNGLAKYAHIQAYRTLGSFEALRSASHANLRQGRYEAEGFAYLEDIDVSIQGMDSNVSWDISLRLARKLDVSLEVVFEWYNKPNAAHPGQTRTLLWEPAA